MVYRKFITPIVLFALVLLLSIGLGESQLNRRREHRQAVQLREALSGELESKTDKLGRETAKRQALEASREDFLKVIAEKDSQLARLQEVVKKSGKRTQFAAVASTVTVITAAAKSEIALAESDSSISYSAFINERWVEGYITADKDSVKLNYLMIHNEYEIWQREERSGFLKGHQPVVYFRNLNPHTRTADVQTFTVKKKKKPIAMKILKMAVLALAVKGGVSLVTR